MDFYHGHKVIFILHIFVNFDLSPLKLTSKSNRIHPLIMILNMWLVWQRSKLQSPFYGVHNDKVWQTHTHMIWPLTSKINRGHPFIMSAKFEEDAYKSSISIMFTKLFPYRYMSIVTLTLTFTLWPPKSIEFILSPRLRCTAVQSLSCSQGYFHVCPVSELQFCILQLIKFSSYGFIWYCRWKDNVLRN